MASVGWVAAAAACWLAGSAAAQAADPQQLELLLTIEAQSLHEVCGTQCHPADLFSGSPRPYDAWHETVQKMVDRGANASEEQLLDIMDYLHRTLTIVNVNSASALELGFTLGIAPDTVQAIIARRTQHKIADLADLAAAVGHDAPLVAKSAGKIVF